MNKRLQTIALFAIVLWVWSSTWLAIRLSTQGVPPMTAAALRMSASGAILLLVALALRSPWPRGRLYLAHVAVQGTLLFGLQFALIYWAEQSIPSGLTAVLFATLPITTAIIAASIFRLERLSPVNLLGLLVGFCGVAVIYWSEVVRGGHAAPLGVAAALLATLCSAFATVFAKRYAHGIPPLATVGPGQLLGGVLLGLLAAGTERGLPIHFTAVSAGALAYLIVFGSVVFLAYFTLMKTVLITRLSLLTYVTPILAVVLGTIVAHERFAPTTLIGAGIVFVGIWLVNVRQRPVVTEAAAAVD